MTNSSDHITVLLSGAIDALQVQPGKWYVDATFGRGGHTQEILNRGGRVIAFDVDEEAIAYGKQHFAQQLADERLILVRSNFDRLAAELTPLLAQKNIQLSGVLFDFGTSTNQLLSDSRGFSFESEAVLDMRMDQRLGVTAEDMLRVLTEKQLARAFRDLGGEHEAKKMARIAKSYIQVHSPVTAKGLAEAIAKQSIRKGKLHPATKVFQALRILVNTELDSIQAALPQALSLLSSDGRIVTIAFHEGEDRLAKQYFAAWEKEGKGQRSPKEAIEPTETEQAHNPRSRSAKMRTFIVW